MSVHVKNSVGRSSWQIVLWLLLTTAFGTSAQAGGVLFVDGDAPAAGDGLSWNTAYRFLQDAIADAQASAGAVNEIRIAGGLYLPDQDELNPGGTGDTTSSFFWIDGLTLRGGYAGFGAPDPDARDIEVYITTLSGDLAGDDGPNFTNRGDNAGHVLENFGVAVPLEHSLVEGFTVRGGGSLVSTVQGGGIKSRDMSMTIRQCIVTDNRALELGGGIYFKDGGTLIIERCLIEGNLADGSSNEVGGGLYIIGGTAIITDTRFVSNTCDRLGGGLGTGISTTLTVDRCEFYLNQSTTSSGAGLYFDGELPLLITNSLFAGNHADGAAGAIFADTSNASQTVRNCTIAFNIADASIGGVYLRSFTASVTSCVLWGNLSFSVAEESQVRVDFATDAVNYCCIQGLTPGYSGIGNIGNDPLFVDPFGPDFFQGTLDDDLHLDTGSPCIDSGDPGLVPSPGETDFDGQPRIIAARVDMGMDEAFSLGLDCNNNGILDAIDIIDGTSQDCNTNTVPDECDIADLTSLDCNLNSVPDECDIADGFSLDCNVNGVPDVCDISSGTSTDNNINGVPDECDPPDPILARAGKKLYVTATGKVHRYDLDGTHRIDLISDGYDAPLDVEVDVLAGKIYWTDSVDHKIHRSNLDGTAHEIIVENVGQPHGIALDFSIGKMYWTDVTNALIRRANIDGTAVETVLSTGLGDPRGIAVNQATGTVYWIDAGTPRIMRMDQGGANVATLITSGLTGPIDVEVDDVGGKLYWTDNPAFETGVMASIRRADLNGGNAEVLALEGPIQLTPRFLALDRVAGKVYWTDISSGSNIKRMNLDGSVLQNLGTAGTGTEGIAVDPVGQKLYYATPLDSNDRLRQTNLDNTNILSLDSELRITRRDVGVQLLLDKMYWTHRSGDIQVPNTIRRADLLGGNVEIVVNGANNNVGDPYGITVSSNLDFIYWGDTNDRIMRAGITGFNPIALIQNQPLLVSSRYVAVDFGGGKLYIGGRTNNLLRANLTGTNLESIVPTPCADPRGVAVDPEGGKVYWAGNCSNTIKRANLDGSIIETLVSGTGVSNIEDLAIDLDGGLMFWTNGQTLHRAKLDGTDVQQLDVKNANPGGRFFGLDILSADCNCNNIPDSQDILTAFSLDVDVNGIPDECDAACNTFGITDTCAISRGESQDCNNNGIPDQCDISANTSEDCNLSLIPDECELGTELDGDLNGILDRCEILPQTCTGDITSDGAVNVTDLLELLANWGPCPSPCSPGLVNDPDSCPADVDRGCAVNVTSLLTLLAAWGPCPP